MLPKLQDEYIFLLHLKRERVCISPSLHWPLGDLQAQSHVEAGAAFNPAKSLEAPDDSSV